MRKWNICICTFILALLGAVSGFSQTSTYILLRHAEKDTSVQGSTQMTADPPLSPKGLQRAASLPDVLKMYTPDAIYSTNYSRTKSTAAPLSAKWAKEVQTYDPKKLNELADLLLAEKGKTIIVVGHSNTTPALANLLIKQNTYKSLDDSVYDQLWIITVTNGNAEARILKY